VTAAGSRRRFANPRLVIVLWAIVAGLVVALGIDIARSGGVAAWVAARLGLPQIAAPAYVRLGTTVDVDGRAVYLDCRGSGSPTVVLESGLGGGADGWGDVLDGLAALTRVCASERPGQGQSEGIGRHSAMTTSQRLHAALEMHGERGPYVVVAHSFGGVYARLFAAAEPGSVESLVMLDTYEPDLGMDVDPALDDATRATIRRNLDEGGRTFEAVEDLDWPATMAELARIDPASLDALLLYTDPAGRYLDPDPVIREAMIAAWYRAIAARYPNGVLEIVPTGHFIQLDRPDLVIDRVRDIVEAVRSR
jgi:pimeloyl-ACP methyl ester carboxylesterase